MSIQWTASAARAAMAERRVVQFERQITSVIDEINCDIEAKIDMLRDKVVYYNLILFDSKARIVIKTYFEKLGFVCEMLTAAGVKVPDIVHANEINGISVSWSAASDEPPSANQAKSL